MRTRSMLAPIALAAAMTVTESASAQRGGTITREMLRTTSSTSIVSRTLTKGTIVRPATTVTRDSYVRLPEVRDFTCSVKLWWTNSGVPGQGLQWHPFSSGTTISVYNWSDFGKYYFADGTPAGEADIVVEVWIKNAGNRTVNLTIWSASVMRSGQTIHQEYNREYTLGADHEVLAERYSLSEGPYSGPLIGQNRFIVRGSIPPVAGEANTSNNACEGSFTVEKRS